MKLTAIIVLGLFFGGCAMASDLNLRWEWPANRQPQFKIVLTVREVRAASKGWFWIKKSPSVIDGLPDPITIRGTIVSGNAHLKGKTIAFTLPKLEADDLRKGDTAAIGVLENNIGICIKRIQSPEEDLSDWKC